MSKIRYNKSKTYLLPLLAEVIEIDTRFFNHLKNTFISDTNDKYKDCIFILHDFSFKNPEFTNYEHKLTNNPYFVDLIDIDNLVLYIFKFPEEYMEEYNLFKKGKYSKFGEDAKKVIINFFGHIYQGNLNAVKFLLALKQILYKDKKLKERIEEDLRVTLPKDAELTDIASMEDETFNITNKK
jgi:hypothetical protein